MRREVHQAGPHPHHLCHNLPPFVPSFYPGEAETQLNLLLVLSWGRVAGLFCIATARPALVPPRLLGDIAALRLLMPVVRLLLLGLSPLMDTTEARYGEISRLMVELNDWVTPWFTYDMPFWGKPPLAFWISALSFKVFGINEFAARFPHWLAGMVVLWILWGMRPRSGPTGATYAIALLLGSVMFFVASGMVMMDMALVIGTTLAMRGFWNGLHGEPSRRG